MVSLPIFVSFNHMCTPNFFVSKSGNTRPGNKEFNSGIMYFPSKLLTVVGERSTSIPGFTAFAS